MRVHILHQLSEAVAQKEADGKARRVGRETENVKRSIRVDAEVVARQPIRQTFERRAQIIVRQAAVCAAANHGAEKAGIGIICALCPADDCRIADVLDVVAVRKQMIQCGGVGKGGVFADWGIVVLLPSVGAERRRVERHQRRAAGLRVPHALDRRVHSGDLILFSGHETLHLDAALAAVPIPLPCLADSGILLDLAAIHAKDEVAARGHIVELPDERRMLCRAFRFPSVEKCQYCAGIGRIDAIQHRVVQLCRGGKALAAAFRLPFLVDAEQISGIVPQKVRGNADRSFHRCRQHHQLRLHDRLFTLCPFHHCRNDLRQLTVFVYVKCETDLRRGPAGRGNLTAREEVFVIPRQRLQDHPLTSLLSGGGTIITPSTRLARKNFGLMFAGSL